jgi:hypothetical protein
MRINENSFVMMALHFIELCLYSIHHELEALYNYYNLI